MMPTSDYYQQLSTLPYSKTFKSWLEKPETMDYMSEFVECMQDDSGFFINDFQSVLDVEVMVYTVGELIDASALTMQNALQTGRVEAIWTDKHTGIASIGQLLKMPCVMRKLDGSLFVLGGNHRIASSIALPFVLMAEANNTEVDIEALRAVEVRCLQYSINLDALKDSLSGSYYDDETDNTVSYEPTDSEVINAANLLLTRLWAADNQSRTMKAPEYAGAKLFEVGIDRNNNKQLIEAAFKPLSKNEARVISPQNAFPWLAKNLIEANDELDYPYDEDGNRNYSTNIIQRGFSIPTLSEEYQSTLTITTFEKIIRSFWSSLAKVKVSKGVSERTGKEQLVSVWSKDLKDGDRVLEIADLITQGDDPLVIKAVEVYLDSLDPDDEFKTNPNRKPSEIGAVLCDLFTQQVEPKYDVLASTKTTRASSKKRPKASLGLGI